MTIQSATRLKQGALRRIRTMAHLLDNALAIPGTKFRVGIDPLLSLFPGAGDWLSTLISAYIVLESLRFGLPRQILLKMMSNLFLDAAGGTIPVAGDLFDVTWKANHRNLMLLEAHLQDPLPQRPADRGFVILMVLLVIALLTAVTLLALFVGRWFWQQVQ
ncbi:MAG: DUF4112 domain-containing protein [Leptolyngbyaceae cyanobacterium bins.349]|nr:DUF4112 domain-containing protein [Leptolyngbyaceae cyanobacterium bins.349]